MVIGVDVFVIVIEWKEFCSLDFMCLKVELKVLVIFDGCNLYELDVMVELGIDYYVIGWLYVDF